MESEQITVALSVFNEPKIDIELTNSTSLRKSKKSSIHVLRKTKYKNKVILKFTIQSGKITT